MPFLAVRSSHPFDTAIDPCGHCWGCFQLYIYNTPTRQHAFFTTACSACNIWIGHNWATTATLRDAAGAVAAATTHHVACTLRFFSLCCTGSCARVWFKPGALGPLASCLKALSDVFFADWSMGWQFGYSLDTTYRHHFRSGSLNQADIWITMFINFHMCSRWEAVVSCQFLRDRCDYPRLGGHVHPAAARHISAAWFLARLPV